MSRQNSGQALRDYRANQAPPPSAPMAVPPAAAPRPSQPVIVDRRPPVSGYGTGGGWSGTSSQSGTQWSGQAAPQGGGWSGGFTQRRPQAQEYAAPPAGYGWAQPGRSFGVWDGVMLWGLLHTLSPPGSTDFFHNNRNTPAYSQWREEAERSASGDPALKARLNELDQRLASMEGQPRNPGAPPPPAPRPASGGSMTLFIVLGLAIALFLALWFWRRQAARPAVAAVAAPVSAAAALKGSTQTRFRVGMTIPVDPTPFVLAGGATKIRPIDGSGMISVEAVGVLLDGPVALNRLYLPGRDSFFQLHLGPNGTPDECRYFSIVDRVAPASQEEWGVWLDPAQGLLGWPQFQTKDGKLYDRVWAPGATRIAPREMEETVQDVQGTTSRKLSAMLYAAPTGVPEPAPREEYILVTFIDMGGQAWIEIHAGIDINPSTLTLPSVALI